jgi:hypothetical protein
VRALLFWRHNLLKPLAGPAPDKQAWMAKRDMDLAVCALRGNTDIGIIELVEGQSNADAAAAAGGAGTTATMVRPNAAAQDDNDNTNDDDTPVAPFALDDDKLLFDELASFTAGYLSYDTRTSGLCKDLAFISSLLEHNAKHCDLQFLTVLECCAAPLLQFVSDVREFRRRMDSTSSPRPTTWGKHSANTMYVHTIPSE